MGIPGHPFDPKLEMLHFPVATGGRFRVAHNQHPSLSRPGVTQGPDGKVVVSFGEGPRAQLLELAPNEARLAARYLLEMADFLDKDEPGDPEDTPAAVPPGMRARPGPAEPTFAARDAGAAKARAQAIAAAVASGNTAAVQGMIDEKPPAPSAPDAAEGGAQ